MNKRYFIATFYLLFFALALFSTTSQQEPALGVRYSLHAKSVRILLMLPKGHYTYKSSPYASPIRVVLKQKGRYLPLALPLPKGIKKGDEVILKNSFSLWVSLAKIRSLVGNNKRVYLRVEYQLCSISDGVCYPPASNEFSFFLTKDGGKKNGVTKGNSSPAQEKKIIIQPSNTSRSLSLEEKLQNLLKNSLDNPLIAFLLAILGGFLASLTPCVYPIIPVTVGYFAKQGTASKRTRLAKALLYVAGMSVVYTVLGVIAGLAGSAFGALTNRPIFFVAVGSIFLLLALSLFELFELRMPSFVQKATPKAQSMTKGGSFFMGAATGLVASPCVGPIIFFLLTGVLQAGKPLYGALLMAGFSIGMGFLFLLLAFFSQSLAHLPKSGNWMVRVKLIFGALVLGSACYFIELAFNGWRISVGVLRLVLLAVVLISAILGARRLYRIYGRAGHHVALLFILLAGLLFFTQWSISSEKLRWGNDYKAAIRQAQKSKKPIFMDLYADWCAICKKVEAQLLKNRTLLAYLEKNYVTLKLNYDNHKLFLEKKFGVKSLPWVLILSPKGEVLWRKVGFSDAGRFVAELKKILPNYLTSSAQRR